MRVQLPLAEVSAEMQAQMEELIGQAGLQILRAILENEVTRRVGPPHRRHPTAGCVRRGKAAGLCGLCSTEDPVGTAAGTNAREPGSRTGGLRSVAARRKLQRAVREAMVAGLSPQHYRRAVKSVLEGCGIADHGRRLIAP